MKIRWCCAPQLSSEIEVSIALLCQLRSTRYISMNQELFEKHLCNPDVQRKPSRATTKSTLFTVRKDEWNTKEDTGKSLKNALDVLWYAKKYLSGWSDVDQWKKSSP